MAIVTPAQGSRKRKHIKCPRKNVTSFKSICSEVSQYIYITETIQEPVYGVNMQ